MRKFFFLGEKIICVVVFGNGLKKIRASFKLFWTGLLKLISTWTEVHFEYKKLRKLFLFILFGFYAKFFRLLVEKFFDVIFKIAFYGSRETLSRQLFLYWKPCVFHSLWRGRKIFRLLSIFSAWISKLHSTCPWGHFGEKYFFLENFHFFLNFRTLSGKISPLWQKRLGFLAIFFQSIVKTAFYLSWRTVWRNFFFSKEYIVLKVFT